MVRYEDHGPFRMLFASSSSRVMQGVMHREQPSTIVLEYALSMMAWLLLADTAKLSTLHAMQLGLGPGMLTKFCHNRLGMKTTALEIDPAVVAASRDWFLLPPNGAKLEVLVGDAVSEIAQPARQATVDVLHVDLYDSQSERPVQDSAEFWAICKASLTPTGCMMVNLYSSTRSYTHWTTVARIQQLFPARSIWLVTPVKQTNLVLMACNQELPTDTHTLVEQARLLESRYGLPATDWLQRLQCPLEPGRVN